MEDQKLDIWAMIELFGHSKIAGKCSERNIGSTSFLQVDVPDTSVNPSFTRLINPSAIYAINPITEEIAIKYAAQLNVKPIESWDIHKFMEKAQQRQLNTASIDDSDD